MRRGIRQAGRFTVPMPRWAFFKAALRDAYNQHRANVLRVSQGISPALERVSKQMIKPEIETLTRVYCKVNKISWYRDLPDDVATVLLSADGAESRAFSITHLDQVVPSITSGDTILHSGKRTPIKLAFRDYEFGAEWEMGPRSDGNFVDETHPVADMLFALISDIHWGPGAGAIVFNIDQANEIFTVKCEGNAHAPSTVMPINLR